MVVKKITHFVNFFALIMHAVNTLFNIYTLSEKMFDDTVIFFFSRWNGGGIAQSPSPPYIYATERLGRSEVTYSCIYPPHQLKRRVDAGVLGEKPPV